MTEIWKFPLRVTDHQIVTIPGAKPKVLTAQFQRGVLCLWAIVDRTKPLCPHEVWIVGTGRQFPIIGLDHIATVQESDLLVWHVFMLP